MLGQVIMRRHPGGFTLIELMVTIAVLCILVTMAFPNLSDYLDKQRLISQMRAISNLAQLARSEAIKQSSSAASGLKTVSFTVGPSAPWYVGIANGSAACSGATCFINEAGNNVSHTVSATECTGCTMTSPAAQAVITFDLRGLATGNTDQSITLQSPMGRQLSLNIGRLGRISLCSPGGAVGGYPTC
ncbi:hypothetical protein DN412_04270 [Cupriavidus lacunae]|uniref:Type II secretion system protein H n=2 Tax=Cupriavidus lacunae TaxID=2666307 RepID=A0A370P134_9BURK|nr:hypothetical protein DN412_04270 [Cupriavidus lacunae]